MILTSTCTLLLLAAASRPVAPLSEEALVEEVRSIHALADHRPTHVSPPLAGTFAELAAPHFERLMPIAKGHLQELRESLAPYARGERPWSGVPEDMRKLEQLAAPEVLGILGASHASSGRLPSNLTGVMRLADPMPEDSAIFAFNVAAVEVRRAIEISPEKALPICADALAVARDFSYGNALGRLVGVAGIGILSPVCVDALRAAPPSETACSAFESIAAHTAPLSAMFEQEKIFGELSFFGSSLSRSTRAELPPEARRVLDQPDPRNLQGWSEIHFADLRDWLFGGLARETLVQTMNNLIDAAGQPVATAEPAIAKISEQRPWIYKLYGADDSPSTWLKFTRRWRLGQTRLNAIAAACTILGARSTKTWPSVPSWALDARTGRPLRLEVSSTTSARLVADPDPARDAERLSFDLSRQPWLPGAAGCTGPSEILSPTQRPRPPTD